MAVELVDEFVDLFVVLSLADHDQEFSDFKGVEVLEFLLGDVKLEFLEFFPFFVDVLLMFDLPGWVVAESLPPLEVWIGF